MAVEPTFVEAAPAKINLYLHVTGQRDDGYHLLDSLVAFADVGDRVGAAPDAALSLIYAGPFADALPPPETNLVMDAADALRRRFGISDGATITLEKNLPVASGIGGGSADAAAVLRALAKLWGIDASDPKIAGLGLSLGADVPVCLSGETAVMRGIGEDLTPIAGLAPIPALLVNPGIDVPTPAVFKARSGGFSDPVRGIDDIGRDPAGFLRTTRNDLEQPAISLAPIIANVLTAIGEQDGVRLARMSGSGATCFGLFDGADQAATAAEKLLAAHPAWWVQPCEIG